MIQRVVRNGRVRAFGAEWELDDQARLATSGGEWVCVHASRVARGGEEVEVYAWHGTALVSVGFATRRPVIDIIERL